MCGWLKAAEAESAPAKEKEAGAADPEEGAVDLAGAEEAADPEEGAVDLAGAEEAADPEEAAGLVAAEAEGLRRRNRHFDTMCGPKALGVRLIRPRGKLFIE